jgi:hypothetical protein
MTDDHEWQTAAEIEESHPHWLVMWGSYSRVFWAFPRFEVPDGTIVSARDRERLLAEMRDVEAEVSAPPVPVYTAPVHTAPTPPARLPQRVGPLPVRRKPASATQPHQRPTRGQAQRGALSAETKPYGSGREGQGGARAPYLPGPGLTEPYGTVPAGPVPAGPVPAGAVPGGPVPGGYDPSGYDLDEYAPAGYGPGSYDPDGYDLDDVSPGSYYAFGLD